VFSEVILRAPGLILAHANYVTKVVFPLELLSIMTLGNAIIHSLLSLCILILGLLIFDGSLHWTIILVPLIYIPLSFYSLGLSWLLSSLGVFIRDMGYLINIIVQILFFMTPIFYPVSSVPQPFKTILSINPMTGIINNARNVIVFGVTLNWLWWIISTVIGLIFSYICLLWFKKSKKAFSDVL
jgi:lipopolysaccharide transport system permease protein